MWKWKKLRVQDVYLRMDENVSTEGWFEKFWGTKVEIFRLEVYKSIKC